MFRNTQSIPRIDGSLRARLQTLTNRFRINGIGRRENSPPDCFLIRLTRQTAPRTAPGTAA